VAPGVKGTIEQQALDDIILNVFPISFEFRISATGSSASDTHWNNWFRQRPSAIYNNPYFCPAFSPKLPDGVVEGQGYTDYAPNIFTHGGGIGGCCPQLSTRRSDIKHPSKVALYTDAAGAGGAVVVNASYNNVMPRHAKGTRANIICMDGHIESCRWTVSSLSSVDIAMQPVASASSGIGTYKVYFWP
jgi:hypothetical protein